MDKETRIKELELELEQLKDSEGLLFKDRKGKLLKVGDRVWSPSLDASDPIGCTITHLWLEWPNKVPMLLAKCGNYDGVSMPTKDCERGR